MDSRWNGYSPWLHHYPWQVALQHGLLLFHDEHAKTNPENVYLQAVLKRGRLQLQLRKDQLFVAVRHLETAAELELSGFEFEAYSEEEFDQLLRSLNESALSRTET